MAAVMNEQLPNNGLQAHRWRVCKKRPVELITVTAWVRNDSGGVRSDLAELNTFVQEEGDKIICENDI